MKRRKDATQIKKDIAHQIKDLFSQKGYNATSMEEVCRVTGRSKGSIYYHFKSKEEMFMYLIKLNNEEWMEAWMAKEAAHETTQEKLFALADHYVDDMNNPLSHAVNEFMSSQVVTEDMLNDMLEVTRLPYKTYEQLITRGMERGELKKESPTDVMYVLNGLINGMSMLYYEKDLEEIRRIYKKGIEILLAGIEAPAEKMTEEN
ncbi:TetR family transcriptional regulator [Paenibacillus sp. Sa2BVA9]|uniref:TetR family transcriptional regulator n=1 Tax=Paenibacillus gallinarum TaxID=2762232 RepID=A0ABR8T389_9BACL|nr:TetR family transcriptional regulator [Paenibacillus gallinarum]